MKYSMTNFMTDDKNYGSLMWPKFSFPLSKERARLLPYWPNHTEFKMNLLGCIGIYGNVFHLFFHVLLCQKCPEKIEVVLVHVTVFSRTCSI